ncbi:YkgB family protein [Flavobacterium sp. MAH-1]|uniref:YkgB family protein n=1 Tax=Flavobacterium agri TaxID=2743471 RepID=A0A7Y8Y3C6_9FLAO|nr:DUF417 family protein [Flavobacterium agri]NUY80510.1 YkgB family protein [Flavobacterium agri]NYA70535.1 YkgB family protein [Flavobacterium agri]
MKGLLQHIANIDRISIPAIRISIAIVFIWIGSLKFFDYEAEGIVPFVANSPFMSFFYAHPSEYKQHVNPEGAYVAENHAWHETNNTYAFSDGLGIFLITIGILMLLYKIAPLWSLAGSVLLFVMTLGTLSFLLTTPENWVPSLGGENFGFPFLSARGRLVIKDVVMLAASLLLMSDSAKLYLKTNSIKNNQ